MIGRERADGGERERRRVTAERGRGAGQRPADPHPEVEEGGEGAHRDPAALDRARG